MLINASRLPRYAILSLHVGGKIANITDLIIDPDSLKLLACRVEGPVIRNEVGDILLMDSVREVSRLGLIIDSIDDFVAEDDVVRVREVLQLRFSLDGLKVETKTRSKLGKVTDYILDAETWRVQQLIVQRPLIKSLFDPELIIPRREIVEVSNTRVLVKDETKKLKQTAPSDFTPNFVNPFRQGNLATEEAKSKKLSN